MKNFLEYKGYHTKVEFNSETMTLRGMIEGINDYIDEEAGIYYFEHQTQRFMNVANQMVYTERIWLENTQKWYI